MDEEKFWNIIYNVNRKTRDLNRKTFILGKKLDSCSAKELEDFNAIFDSLVDKAYNWDLWAVAYIINGGCSDDSFIDFRYWMISKGKDVYYRLLENADIISDIDFETENNMDLFFEEFGYVASDIYLKKFNKNIPQKEGSGLMKPMGKEWTEEDLKKRYPKTYAKYGLWIDES